MEKDDLTAMSDAICRMADIPEIELRFRDVTSYGARAFLPGKIRGNGYIAIATKVLEQNKAYAEAVVIHEICHFLYWKWHKENRPENERANHHGTEFKRLEIKWLRFWGMVPVYSGIYWKALYGIDDKLLWSKYKDALE